MTAMKTTAEILEQLALTFDQRARDREEESEVHHANNRHDLYSYSLGLVSAYRGAARKVRYEIAQLEG